MLCKCYKKRNLKNLEYNCLQDDHREQKISASHFSSPSRISVSRHSRASLRHEWFVSRLLFCYIRYKSSIIMSLPIFNKTYSIGLSINLAKLGGLSQFVSSSSDYGHYVIGRIKTRSRRGGGIWKTWHHSFDPINLFKTKLRTANQIILRAYNLDETYKWQSDKASRPAFGLVIFRATIQC